MKEIFGIYNIRARLSVGILFLAPLLIELYLLLPEIREFSTTIIVILIVYPISNIIIISSRRAGSKAMKKCFPKHLPAQEFLLPSNKYIDNFSKLRYYEFFKKNIKTFTIYDTDEKMEMQSASAITWLISQTRDISKFPLIAEENIDFGFSYNLLGLKPYSILLTILNIIGNLLLIFLYCKGMLKLNIMAISICLVCSILFLILWIFIINKLLVVSCGKKYARALLSACDSKELN